jgi:uroporphyrin-III C-methyltransferase
MEATVRSGSLTVVGAGIDITMQLTPGARAAIEGADVVLYGLTDPLSALRVEALNPRARSLDGYYAPEKDRRLTYAEMVEAIVSEALRGASVCVVLYGHPGVFAAPGHEAVRQVRAAGLPARMLPGVSALDCLFADLGIDPGSRGLLAYEATHFFRTQPPLDPRATLVLLQVGMLGEEGGAPTAAVAERFPLLVEMLRPHYDEGCEAILYEASPYPGMSPTIVRFQLRDREFPVPTTLATLCITPP